MSSPWDDPTPEPPPDELFPPPPEDSWSVETPAPDAEQGQTPEPDPLGELGERISALEETVAEIIDSLNLAPDGPWVWHRLKDDARRKLATDLVGWVEWLSSRYLSHMSQDILKLPTNWYTNPVVVEMLTALYVGYLSVYSSRRRVPSMALIEWHERGLWPTLDRLKALKLINKDGVLYTTTYQVTTDPDAIDVLSTLSPVDNSGSGEAG